MKWFFLAFLCTLPQIAPAQAHGKITALLAGRNLKAGIALCDLMTVDTMTINEFEHFPMQSVFKFPIALTVLKGVDDGRWQLRDSIWISKCDLLSDTWSPLREHYPNGELYLSIADLIRYTVSQSDNNGCDILLRILGGTGYVNDYIRTLGITEINIVNTEEEMHRDWQTQFSNWATPRAMLDLLRLFHAQRLLQPDTQAFLWETMAATSTGSVRTKLPVNAVVAHKTGTSGRNAAGIAAATNDVGILCRPDGRHVAYVVFITDSAEPDQVNASIIADIAHILYTEALTTTEQR